MPRYMLAAVCATALSLLTPALAAAAKPFKVTSTLDGKSVLPRHLHWVAVPSIASHQVDKVEFRIDGKLVWLEEDAPYVYSEDENGLHKGYLVTTWLTPGRHRFTVRAIAGNRSATDTVTARVLPAPKIPAALAGTWQRDVPGPIPPLPNAASKNPAPGGTYTIDFDRRWIRETNPGSYTPVTTDSQVCNGCIELEDYLAAPSTLQVWGAVTTNAHLITDPNDPVGGWWCFADGPSATYSWKVTGNTLTLTPIGGHDACSQRGTVWTGTWTRT